MHVRLGPASLPPSLYAALHLCLSASILLILVFPLILLSASFSLSFLSSSWSSSLCFAFFVGFLLLFNSSCFGPRTAALVLVTLSNLFFFEPHHTVSPGTTR